MQVTLGGPTSGGSGGRRDSAEQYHRVATEHLPALAGSDPVDLGPAASRGSVAGCERHLLVVVVDLLVCGLPAEAGATGDGAEGGPRLPRSTVRTPDAQPAGGTERAWRATAPRCLSA